MQHRIFLESSGTRCGDACPVVCWNENTCKVTWPVAAWVCERECAREKERVERASAIGTLLVWRPLSKEECAEGV